MAAQELAEDDHDDLALEAISQEPALLGGGPVVAGTTTRVSDGGNSYRAFEILSPVQRAEQ